MCIRVQYNGTFTSWELVKSWWNVSKQQESLHHANKESSAAKRPASNRTGKHHGDNQKTAGILEHLGLHLMTSRHVFGSFRCLWSMLHSYFNRSRPRCIFSHALIQMTRTNGASTPGFVSSPFYPPVSWLKIIKKMKSPQHYNSSVLLFHCYKWLCTVFIMFKCPSERTVGAVRISSGFKTLKTVHLTADFRATRSQRTASSYLSHLASFLTPKRIKSLSCEQMTFSFFVFLQFIAFCCHTRAALQYFIHF